MREYKLAGPRGDGQNPYLNRFGAFLADGTPLLESDSRGRWKARTPLELSSLLVKNESAQNAFEWRMQSLNCVARALNDNDVALASISLVLMKLSDVDGERTDTRKSGRSDFIRENLCRLLPSCRFALIQENLTRSRLSCPNM